MTVGEVCNRAVVIAKPGDSIAEAVRLMKTYHIGDVVVVEERQGRRVPIGIITDRDIALAVGERAVRLPFLRIDEVMSHDIVTAVEQESLHDALKKMRSFGVRRLPVVNERGGLEGIVAFDDVIGLLSEELHDLAALVEKAQTRERLEPQGR
jgi:CBS domain-containing protein